MKDLTFLIDYVPTDEDLGPNDPATKIEDDFNEFFKEQGVDIVDAKMNGYEYEWPEMKVTIHDKDIKKFFDAYNGEDNDVTTIEDMKDNGFLD